MSFSKYRIIGPAAVFFCLLAVPLPVAAQNMTIIQSNSGDAFLGISMEDVTASNMSEYSLTDERGVIVVAVQEGSPAEEAGLREKDVILEFAGQSVLATRQFSRLVSEMPVGRKVTIKVTRNGKPVSLFATLGARTARSGENRQDQRLFEVLPGDRLERFFELLPGDQFRSQRPERPDAQGGRQGAERAEQRPRLGVETQPLTEQLAEHMGVPGKKGVLITAVLDGSASEGKLKAGDVVIGVNNQEIASPADLTRAIREAASGEITVKVIRDKKQLSISITLNSEEKQKSGGYRL